jgi:hypothetical protein
MVEDPRQVSRLYADTCIAYVQDRLCPVSTQDQRYPAAGAVYLAALSPRFRIICFNVDGSPVHGELQNAEETSDSPPTPSGGLLSERRVVYFLSGAPTFSPGVSAFVSLTAAKVLLSIATTSRQAILHAISRRERDVRPRE